MMISSPARSATSRTVPAAGPSRRRYDDVAWGRSLARRWLGFTVMLLWAAASWAQSSDFTRSVNTRVSEAKRVAPELGVHIVDIESGESMYSYRHQERRIVASNTKLFTTAAALDRLGPGFFFETEVLWRGQVVDGVLQGDVAVIGGGDPNISGRWHQGDSLGAFRPWAAALREQGIRQVQGELWLLPGIFDDQWVHPDWPKDQLTRWYEAPVAGLSFNDNCVLVKVHAGPRSGEAATVETVPPVPLFDVASSARTVGRSRDQWLSIDRRSGAESHVLTVRGGIYLRAESYDKWVTVQDPVAYFAAALRQGFQEEGVVIRGGDRRRQRLEGAGWKPLFTHRSGLLSTLEVINKRSQNFYAESVLKLLGHEHCGAGTWERGLTVVEEFLAEAGLAPQDYSMADGSGMSRNNRFTPQQVTTLLRHMFFHRWGDEYVRTLPYSGEVDLKWERRLAEPPYRGNVLAKTGYLNGVSTLSGYAKARSGKLYAFSILLNRIQGPGQAKKAQDKIVRALIDHG